jgi:hypothetical protein
MENKQVIQLAMYIGILVGAFGMLLLMCFVQWIIRQI